MDAFCEGRGIEVASENAVIALPDQIVDVHKSFGAVVFAVHTFAVPWGQTKMVI